MDRMYFGGNDSQNSRGIYRGAGPEIKAGGAVSYGGRTPYNDADDYGDLMEISSRCSRFERRGDFDVFYMSDYQSCENCRHLAYDDRCIIK